MELTEHRCQRCGAELEKVSESSWKCKYCGCTYDDTTAQKNAKQMQELFDEAKRETINNLRRNLYDATTAEFISSNDVKNACVELKKYLPDDFRANFYEIAVSHNEKKLTQAIRKINVEANYAEIENIVIFLIKSLQPEFLLELNNLVERAYKGRDLQTYEKYATEISVQAEKVQLGVYETKLPREVFVAYSSKDMEKVSELVEVLEAQGIKCFVAARNLRHGKGSVENYDRALKEAMDHCKSFVFVSSLNSRSLSCDALEIEIPYIQKQDIENAPAEYRNNYTAIPHKYKKPRVEYRIESSKGFNAADQITGEFFDGYEWVLSPDEVAVRILKQLVAAPEGDDEHKPQSKSNKKYCIYCGHETSKTQNFCSSCGKTEFVDDIGEFIKIKNQRDMEERRRKEEEQKKASAQGSQNIYKNTATQTASVPAKKQKSKAVAILLAFFLGSLGIDQFYLGYTKRGVWRIVWTCLSCGIVSGIWSLADCIRIASGSLPLDPNDQKKPKKKKSFIKGFFVFLLMVGIFVGVLWIFDDIFALGIFESTSPNPDYEDPWINNDPWNGVATEVPVYGDKGEWDGIDYELSSDGSLIISGSGILSQGFFDNVYLDGYGYAKDRITSVSVEGEITEINDNTFSYMKSLESVKLSPNVKRIGHYAFEYCDNLSYIDLGGVEYIGWYAFRSCGSLTEIDISNVTEIMEYAFSESYNLKTFIGGEKLQSVSEYAFNNTAFYEGLSVDNPLYIGNTLIKVHSETAGNFTVESYATSIAPYAIFKCSYINQVIIPDSVTYIGQNALAQSDYIDSVIYLGTDDEWNKITFGYDWNYQTGWNTSNGTYNLLFMNGEYDPDAVESYTNGLTFAINEDTGTYFVTGYNGSETNVVIPEKFLGIEVTGIKKEAFCNNKNIISVQIPTTLKYIGDRAFAECYSLESFVLSDTSDTSALEEIKASAFCNCYNLNSFDIGVASNINNIELEAFYNTGVNNGVIVGSPFYIGNVIVKVHEDEIGTFEVPSHITYIAAQAFRNCDQLQSVIIPLGIKGIGSYAFENAYYLQDLVYVGTEDEWGAVQRGEGWDYSMGSYTSYNTYSIRYLNGIYDPDASESYTPGLSFTYNSSTGTYYVGNYNGTETSVTIPSTYLGTPVTGIADNAFDGNNYSSNTKITDVKIPESITEIGYRAFYCCSSISTIEIPASVTKIGLEAFESCSSLSSVTFANGIQLAEIPEECFSSTGIEALYIPDSVVRISSNAFNSCESLKTVSATSQSKLKEIKSYAFGYCYAIENLNLTGSVTEVNDYAFYDVQNIKILSAPPEVIQYLGNCNNIEEITVVGSGAYGTSNMQNHTALKRVTFGDGITSISNSAFYGCSALEYVYLGSSLETIGSDAFAGCEALESITIPENVTTIGSSAFSGCSALTEITLPEGLTLISDYTFNGTTSLTAIEIPSSVASIGSYSFANSGLVSITIPAGVSTIGYDAFRNCSSLQELTIAGKLDSVDYSAFEGCLNIRKLTMTTDGISKVLKNSSSLQSTVREIVLTGGKNLPEYAFDGCKWLNKVTLHEGLTTIGNYAFNNCISLMSLTIPSTLAGCGTNSFSYCNKLVEVINNSSMDISPYLTACLVSDGTESRIEYADDYAFITLDSGETYLLGYLGEATELTLPESYNGSSYEIYQYAFAYDQSITSVSIPSVEKIGDYAFYECTSIKSVSISDDSSTPITIGTNAFEYCTALSELSLGSGVETIKDAAFRYCSSLEEVIIPTNVKMLGMYVFEYCSSLSSVIFEHNTYKVSTYETSDLESISTTLATTNSVTNKEYVDTYSYYYWYKY